MAWPENGGEPYLGVSGIVRQGIAEELERFTRMAELQMYKPSRCEQLCAFWKRASHQAQDRY